MKYETIVETTSDGRLALRLVIVPDEPEECPNPKNGEGQGYVVILPVEEDQEQGVITWQM
jgi:hypothetical protein